MILDEENSKSVMSIARFFCADLEGQLIELEPAEAHHLLNVRRVRAGEEVELFDGKGQKLRGRLKEAGKKTAKIEVLQRYAKSPAGVEIVVACAMAKGSRWNWLLEKCVELGAGEIWPVIFERSVATGSGSPKQLSKWNSRCIEAAKQCGQPYLPQLSQPKRLEQVLEETKDDWTGLVGTMNESAQPILGALKKAKLSKALVLLIGPEGGLSDAEHAQARSSGYLPVFLTENTLRVETAAVAFLATVRAWMDSQIKNKKSK